MADKTLSMCDVHSYLRPLNYWTPRGESYINYLVLFKRIFAESWVCTCALQLDYI